MLFADPVEAQARGCDRPRALDVPPLALARVGPAPGARPQLGCRVQCAMYNVQYMMYNVQCAM